MDYEKLLRTEPYKMERQEKEKSYLSYMAELTRYHRKHCGPYGKFLDVSGCADNFERLDQVPMLPVSVFKKQNLYSIQKEEIFKILTSSGTTGQQVSKIYLDRETAARQQKTLSVIMEEFLGSKRIPMLILDSPDVLKDRKMFSARGAGILGFSIFASERLFAFDRDMQLDLKAVEQFLEKHQGEHIFVFGFTYMIWQCFVEKLRHLGRTLPIPGGFMLHGGGWKKLHDIAVTGEEFQAAIYETCGIKNVRNYYGMVEQTGCIYMECEYGHLHASVFSEVITRRARDFSACQIGEEGLIQVMSPMAWSYPGYSLLTEDQGVILGKDDCPCGRKGTYFKVNGRIKRAEIRGCSDTYER